MSSLKSEFGNIKGHQIEPVREIVNVSKRDYAREAHGIQDGIRKDKKIKMQKKYS